MPTHGAPTNNSLTPLDPPTGPSSGRIQGVPAEARARLVRRGPDARGAHSLREAQVATTMLNGIGCNDTGRQHAGVQG